MEQKRQRYSAPQLDVVSLLYLEPVLTGSATIDNLGEEDVYGN